MNAGQEGTIYAKGYKSWVLSTRLDSHQLWDGVCFLHDTISKGLALESRSCVLPLDLRCHHPGQTVSWEPFLGCRLWGRLCLGREAHQEALAGVSDSRRKSLDKI